MASIKTSKKKSSSRVLIFDTTLRDGEQSPGSTMHIHEKLRIANALSKLNVDVLEAGFPMASKGDFEAVKTLAKEVKGPVIAALCRTGAEEIEKTWKAIQEAKKPRIHTFIATSPIHMKYKLRLKPTQVLQNAVRAVKKAKSLTHDVEFSAEDSTRSERSFLKEIFTAVIEVGATTINVPDTVGFTTPKEFSDLISFLTEEVINIQSAVLSVHCHNDLGLAVANSIAAIEAGARQVECTINGIGERAGNASLEEIVMTLRTRNDILPYKTQINTQEIFHCSRLLSSITGIQVQPNKAIVGANAFAHEAGIHQDGLIKKRKTYQILRPKDVGISKTQLVLGKHSGRKAFQIRLKKLGFSLKKKDIDIAFQKFKDLADKKKKIFDEDLEAIIAEEIIRIPDRYKLIYLESSSGNVKIPSATVEIEIDGEKKKNAAFGDGPVDATYKAIQGISHAKAKLVNYHLRSSTEGADAQGEVVVTLEENGLQVRGQGTDTDINVASAKAFINALNRLELRLNRSRTRAQKKSK